MPRGGAGAVYETEVEDVTTWDDLCDDRARNKGRDREAPPVSPARAEKRPHLPLANSMQDTLIRELTIARRTLSLQQEQAMARVERTCVESIARMETTITKLRLEKVRLEEEVKRSEDRTSRSSAPTVVGLQGPRAAAVGLPAADLAQPEPRGAIGAPERPAPKMDFLDNSFSLEDCEQELQVSEADDAKSVDRDDGLRASSTSMAKLGYAKAAEARAGRGQKVFVDAAGMKEKVREAVMKPEYNVFDYYKDRGHAQRIARSHYFENCTLLIVFVNAVWIWIDTDFNGASTLSQAHPVFILADNFFCTYFALELVIRFMAFSRKRFCLQDSWFNFDSVLVALMILETWIMPIVVASFPEMMGTNLGGGGAGELVKLIRLMRLTRMARMVRLLRALPELMVLVKSVVVAVRSVFFTLCLLVVFIYIYALIFVQLDQTGALGGAFTDKFQKVPEAMLFLLMYGILPDLASNVYEFGDGSWIGSVIFLTFILIASLTIMNMLLGVLVQVVGAISETEHERMTVQWVKVKLLEMMQSSGLDNDGNMQISKEEFQRLLLNPKAAKMVQEVGVDVVGLVDFADFIFENDRELTFAEFMELVLQLRGSNTATVKDIVDLRKFISVELQSTVKKQIGRALQALAKEVRTGNNEAQARHFLPQVKSLDLVLTGDEV